MRYTMPKMMPVRNSYQELYGPGARLGLDEKDTQSLRRRRAQFRRRY